MTISVGNARAGLDAAIENGFSTMAEGGMDDPRNARFASMAERVLALAGRNPILAMMAAAGAGWLMYRMLQSRSSQRYRGDDGPAGDIPVLNTGQARIYDPDASPLHPTQDSLQSRREMSARV